MQNEHVKTKSQDFETSLDLVMIDLYHKSHNASLPYPTIHHFVAEMCTCMHISVTKWCVVGYLFGALWDFEMGQYSLLNI